MKKEISAFTTIPISHQNRFEDRISFLHFEYAKIVQRSNGLVALQSDEDGGPIVSEIQLPVAGVALLSLGPGTSITSAALTSCARSGCIVQITGGGGFPAHSTISPLASDSRWAIAQASVVSNQTEARKVAKEFYRKQFNVDDFAGSIAQMRGIEGSLVKKIYAKEAKRSGLKNWRRDTRNEDAVNVALNVGNSLLYGICASLVGALSMNPALGIIHRGNSKSLLFDLADLYKPNIAIPAAFRLHDEEIEDVPRLIRSELRREIHKRDLMKDLSTFVIKTFEPYTPENNEERLIGLQSEVDGHVNYAEKKSEIVAEDIVL